MRIDLERKIINHHVDLQLEQRTDLSLEIEGPGLPDITEQVMLDSDEMNYS